MVRGVQVDMTDMQAFQYADRGEDADRNDPGGDRARRSWPWSRAR
jgi:hypothetical protein